jgi:hypothetical protein
MGTKKRRKKNSKAKISLDKTERTLIRLGLDLIVNRLATAKAGSYPYAHPLARISPQAAKVYQIRAYSEEFAAKLSTVRNQISPEKPQKDFQLDVFDLAATALALRVTRRKQLWKQASKIAKRRLRKLSDPPDPEITALLRRLENARRRAKPKIGTSKHKQYAQQHKVWRAFVAWARYCLLYDEAEIQRILRRGLGIPGTGRNLARLRFEALLHAAQAVIHQRTTAQIPAPELMRLVKLASKELQPSRSRHPERIVDLERNPQQAQHFMFEFIKKRSWQSGGKKFELYPFLKKEFVPALRTDFCYGDAFDKNLSTPLQSRTEGSKVDTPKPHSHFDEDSKETMKPQKSASVQVERTSPPNAAPKRSAIDSGGIEASQSQRQAPHEITAAPSHRSQERQERKVEDLTLDKLHEGGEIEAAPLSEINERFKEDEVVSGIVRWLQKEEIRQEYWPQLIARAQSRMVRAHGQVFRAYPRPIEGLTFARLLEECCPGKRPEYDIYNPWQSELQKTDFLANWIVIALAYVYRSPNKIRQVLQEALDEAWVSI